MAISAKTKRNLMLAAFGAAGGLVIGLLAGCQSGSGRAIHGEIFPPDEQVRPVDRMLEAQSASAARRDGTLNTYHFDRGGALNSLGREKLDLMLRDDDEAVPLVVYLDVRDRAGGLAPYEDAVRRYLTDRGIGDGQVDFRTGPNLDYTRPARDGLRGLQKLDGLGDEATGETDKAAPLTDMTGSPPAPKK